MRWLNATTWPPEVWARNRCGASRSCPEACIERSEAERPRDSTTSRRSSTGRQMTPLFISLEGPDGGGKTTQAARLVARLDAEGYGVVSVHEPGGTDLGN